MESNLELNLKLTTTSPVGGLGGGWVEVILEVGVELLNSTQVNVHSIYIFSTTRSAPSYCNGCRYGVKK